jgi:hypothetical protein
LETTGCGVALGHGPAILRGVGVRPNSAATIFGNWATLAIRGPTARAFGANDRAEVAWAGAGGEARKVEAGMAGFRSGALNWSARGPGTMFGGRVGEAFASGRGGTDSEAAYDSVAGGAVTLAVEGPARRAAEGTGGELSLETTGGGVVPGSGPAIWRGVAVGHNGAASLMGAPHCSQNSALTSIGPLQKRQVGHPAAWALGRGLSSARANSS